MSKIVLNGEEVDVDFRFNITLKTLEDAVKFAKENPDGCTECFSMAIIDEGIGSAFFIGSDYASEHISITDFDNW